MFKNHIELIDEEQVFQQCSKAIIEIDNELCKKQQKLTIGNVDVYFPHEPYDVQMKYMESVVQVLNEKCNGLLESPTGTGKTLSLLCASLGWLSQNRIEQLKSDNPNILRIIYVSRTHSQLKQVAQELKRTAYKPKISMVGSRDQYCLKNSSNLKGNALAQGCRRLVQQKACNYYNKEKLPQLADQYCKLVNSLEETKEFGSSENICPFYFERERLINADLILASYNYLLEIQSSNIINIAGSIIIFDEAHNVPSTSESGQSFSIDEDILEGANKELKKWFKKLEEDQELFKYFQMFFTDKFQKILKDYQQIEQTIETFHQFITNLKTKSYFKLNSRNEQTKIFDSQQIFNFLFENTSLKQQTQGQLFTNGINKDNILQYIQQCITVSELMNQNSAQEGSNFKSWTGFIINIYNLIQKYNDDQKMELCYFYKLAVILNNKNNISLNMWCLDPSLAFKKILSKGIHSIILTSGTLSPMASWEDELQIEFKIKLSNSHVIDIKKNVRAFQHQIYDFSFAQRKNQKQIENLGQHLLQFSQIIQGGFLVVFSSYALMEEIKRSWFNNKVILKLKQVKECFWEEQGSAQFQKTLEDFKKTIQQNKGAILFAIHRGKAAEGIDLSDELCRAVFLIGIPYPPLEDQKIIQKKEYLDKQKANNQQGLSSKDWYSQQAIRATNQSIGRVIRHINDYGAIFLCDKRFQWSDMRFGLSKWVQPAIQPWINDNVVINSLKTFYEGFKNLMDEQIRKNILEESLQCGHNLYPQIKINENKQQIDIFQENDQISNEKQLLKLSQQQEESSEEEFEQKYQKIPNKLKKIKQEFSQLPQNKKNKLDKILIPKDSQLQQ